MIFLFDLDINRDKSIVVFVVAFDHYFAFIERKVTDGTDPLLLIQGSLACEVKGGFVGLYFLYRQPATNTFCF